jgi:hypothetical protein
MVAAFRGQDLEANYLAYFACFNQQLFFEAHEVLEEIWLPKRQGKKGAFYKGLIQLAGAFVHLQKDRLGPAAALFRLARTNLGLYGPVQDRLDVNEAVSLATRWLRQVESAGLGVNPLSSTSAPRLRLEAGSGSGPAPTPGDKQEKDD